MGSLRDRGVESALTKFDSVSSCTSVQVHRKVVTLPAISYSLILYGKRTASLELAEKLQTALLLNHAALQLTVEHYAAC
jgi:hypothetical protein